MRVSYRSNNSGGRWWLKDEDWKNLEAAGWDVKWAADDEDMLFRDKSGRYLGALAHTASKEVANPGEAIRSFEEVTGQDTSVIGCTCCGPPHSFSWGEDEDWGYCAGSSVLEYLYDEVVSHRSALEKLNKK